MPPFGGGRAVKMDIHGNSHVMMMDRNSRQTADLIDDWLAKRELKRRARTNPPPRTRRLAER
jgi:hypothetical protein